MFAEPALAVLPYPMIDPVIFQIGPFAIRWYALAYIAGLIGGWRYMRHVNYRYAKVMRERDVDDLLVWVTIGVVLGGRLGYVLFYNPGYYLAHPLSALAIWQGGMSFHGGLLGVVVALVVYARRRGVSLLSLADTMSVVVPIGLFFGRIANFINAELFGRPSDVPWAMVFPTDPERLPRHPSQLYEAALEGLALFALLWLLSRRPGTFARPGLLTGVFLIGYAAARMVVELARQPDAHLGFLALGSTMGQWLSVPMVLGGLYLIWRSGKSGPAAAR